MTIVPGSAQRFGRSPHADSTLAGDRAAIYHRISKKAITLNPSGTILWGSLESPKTAQELIAFLQERWPQVDSEILARDVQAFIEQLHSYDLLVAEE